MPRKLRLGIGAKCSALVKYMQPTKVIDDEIPYRASKICIQILIVVREDIKVVKKKNHFMLFFRHGNFDFTEMYCVQLWVKVEIEGPYEHIFERKDNNSTDVTILVEYRATVSNLEVKIPSSIFRSRNCPEDVSAVRNQGLAVDYDNDLEPENVHQAGYSATVDKQEWGWGGVCNRATTAAQNHWPSIIGVHGMNLEVMTTVEMFLIFFPRKYLERIVCKHTSKVISHLLSFGELLCYLGIWSFLTKLNAATMDRREFWSSRPIIRKRGAPYKIQNLMIRG